MVLIRGNTVIHTLSLSQFPPPPLMFSAFIQISNSVRWKKFFRLKPYFLEPVRLLIRTAISNKLLFFITFVYFYWYFILMFLFVFLFDILRPAVSIQTATTTWPFTTTVTPTSTLFMTGQKNNLPSFYLLFMEYRCCMILYLWKISSHH